MLEDIKNSIIALGGFSKCEPLEMKVIESIETKIGKKLPDDYKIFLLEYGNSIFSENIFFKPKKFSSEYIHDELLSLPNYSFHGSGLSCFYGISSDSFENSLGEILERYQDRMPNKFLPIADDGLGNQICISLNDEAYGYIYWWDHENEWDEDDYKDDTGENMPEDAKFQNVYLVATSFHDFLSKLIKD